MVQYANILSNGSSGGSGYSALSGAMKVSSVPCYLLPQPIPHGSGSIAPVTFNTNGTMGMPLKFAGGTLSGVTSAMKGGSDHVFNSRSDITHFNLHIRVGILTLLSAFIF